MKIIKLHDALSRIANNSPYYQYKYSNDEVEKDAFLTKKQSRYALLLGAGASVESSIPSANDMIKYFASAICKSKIACRGIFDETNKNRLEWLRKNGYYDNNEDLYSSLFEKCFEKRYERRDFIEKQVEGKIPSLGYIALAHLLKKQTFDTIITTNFDDLIYIASTHFTNIRPVIFSLGGFASEVASVVNRPRVLKIHGDYLFQHLMNTRAELMNQDPNMEQQVKEIINNYKGLVVLGYAGNDDSVMEILNHFPDDGEKNLFWCVYKDEKINWKVEKLLNSKGGSLVRTDGFDKFMLDLAKIEGIRFSDLIESLLERNELIIQKFTSFNLDKNDLDYEHEEKSIERQHRKLQNALEVMRLLTLGNKLFEEKAYEEAEGYYGTAKKLKKNEADAYYNYAKVVSLNLITSHIAIFYFEQAIKLNPDDAYARNRYANMLVKLRSLDEAEKLYEEARDKAEKYVYPIIGLGDVCFLRGDLAEAEKWYLKAKAMETATKSSRLALAEIHYKLYQLQAILGRPDESKQTLKEALRREIGLLEYLTGEVRHYNKVNDGENAKRLNEKIGKIKELFRSEIETHYGKY